MADLLEQLKAALADRYAVARELGHGGMARVYLAEDLKHHRAVALKVLKPELAQALGPERFLREIEISARLAHPHILPLLDSGDADGLLFYTMPYVESESLRDRLARETQLPLEDALRIAREVADALGYAHSMGLVHRDIKPENILFEAGHAVVADFGIARAVTAAGGQHLTDTGIALGTPAYMSPEQATGEQTIDGRSDLYSLGCVLYEMLAGEPPFTGPTAQAILAKRFADAVPRVSVVREAVPPAVEAAITKLLARAPADRFATAQQFAAALAAPAPAPEGARSSRRRRLRIPVVIAGLVVAGLGVAGALRLLSSSGIEFAERDWIVVADFVNQTGDSVFEGSLSAALRVGLEQSRYVNVLPRARIAAILSQMERSDTTRLDEAVGREIALRANARVLVVPAISRIDSTYLLTMRVVDPPDAVDLVTRSARAQGKGAVLGALDGLARRLRRDLGESRRAVAQNGVRLDHATTPSLEALRAWTEGNRYWNTRRFEDAAERYRQALRLDSGFAMAHQTLGRFYAWTARQDSSEYHFRKALGELDRVTERERLLIQAAFYGAQANWGASIRAEETYVDRYPDDLGERFNLGSSYMRAGRQEDAIRTLRQVIESDSTHVLALINLATAYTFVGDYADALVYYRRAFVLRPDFRLSGNLNHEFGFTFLQVGQPDSAEATFSAMLSGSVEQQAQGQRSLGLLRMYQGRYREARYHLERAVALTQARAPVSELRNDLYLAATYATAGQTRASRAAIARATAAVDTVGVGALWLSRLAAGYARLGDTVALRRLLTRIRARVTEGSTDDQAALANTEARLALARGDYAKAATLLERAVLAAGTNGDEHRGLLALAYRLAGQPVQAESTYLTLVGTKQALGWEAQEPWILAHYELGTFYQERGDTAKALDYYNRFLTIWQDGDSDLVALRDARARLRALTGPG
jgi:tetratricopeptide (TPR) repeat protein/tRNA A-37 threonylcarbamoyl transferase component Bud32